MSYFFHRGIVRHQINVEEHNPEYCSDADRLDGWGTDPNCPAPLFGAGEPSVSVYLSRCIFPENELFI